MKRAYEPLRFGLLAAASALAIGACSGNGSNDDAQTSNDASTNDVAMTAAGTCDMPIELATAGMRNGMTLTYSGTTEGATNTLHPNPSCSAVDSGERVFHYSFPDGVDAIRVSTEGSSFDTSLYARTACEQPANAMDVNDVSCNNDSYDHSPQSLMYVMRPEEGTDVFIVVDGSSDYTQGMDSGSFTLTVTEVPLGVMGNPCRAAYDEMGNEVTNRCDGALGCSMGGAPDGTALCVPVIANNMACDQRGFTNTCVAGSTCASDPTPPDGMEVTPLCSPPGSRAGAPCAMTEPRCATGLACGTGDYPMCVRVLGQGDQCDVQGYSNVCGTGLTCRPMGDSGSATCEQ